MAIKMRKNTKSESVCCECSQPRKKVLDMFDVCIGGNIFTICDLCNEVLSRKTLSASCYTNGRVKLKEDMAIIHARGREFWKIKGAEELKRQLEAEAKYANDKNENE